MALHFGIREHTPNLAYLICKPSVLKGIAAVLVDMVILSTLMATSHPLQIFPKSTQKSQVKELLTEAGVLECRMKKKT